MTALILPGQFASWQNGLVHAVWQGKELSEFSSVNGFTKTVTPAGEAIRLTGTQYMTRRLPAGFNFPLTFVSVFRRNVASASRVLASVGSGTQRHLLYFASGNGLALYSAAEAATGQVGSFGISDTTNVYFAAGRVSSASSRDVFVNGVFYSPNTAAVNTTPQNVHAIGAYWNNDAAAGGFVSDADILFSGLWNRALSNAEILDLHNSWRRITRPAQRRIWVPVSTGGLLQLQKESDFNFSIRDFLSDSVNLEFRVREQLSDTLTLSSNLRTFSSSTEDILFNIRNYSEKSSDTQYKILGSISESASIDYTTRGLSQATTSLDYTVRSFVIDTTDFNYGLRGTVVVNNGLDYTLRTLLSSDITLSYNILSSNQVIKSVLLEYKIRTSVDKTTGVSWYIRSVEIKNSGLIYTVRAKKSSSEEVTYKIYSNVGSSDALLYNIRGNESKTSNFSYNILGITQVKKDLPLLYSVLSSIAPDWTNVYVETSSIADVYVRSEDTFVVILK